jgi:hypothetical protein
MDSLFTEESLARFFEPYGKVVDVSIKNSSIDQVPIHVIRVLHHSDFESGVSPHRLLQPIFLLQNNGIQRGYGFVHFDKTNEGMKAAVLAVENEIGDSTVSLECEVSKNLLKHSPFLRMAGNKEGGLSPIVTNLLRMPSAEDLTTIPENHAPAQNHVPTPVVSAPIVQYEQNYEPIQDHYYDQGHCVYYTNSASISGDSSPKICYPTMMHSMHMAPFMAPVHPTHLQNGDSYNVSRSGEEPCPQPVVPNGKWLYVYDTETDDHVAPLQQEIYYQCADQYGWTYHANNSMSTTGVTDSEGSDCSTPQNGLDLYPESYGLMPGTPNVNEEIDPSHSLTQSQDTSTYMNSPNLPQQVNIHGMKTYPQYIGYQQQIPQNGHYVFQPPLSGSPQVNNRAYYSPVVAASNYRFSPKVATYLPPLTQPVIRSPVGPYQQQLYPVQGPYPFQGNHTIPYCSPRHGSFSYSSMVDTTDCVSQNCKQPFIKKASAALQRFKSLA